MSNLPEKWTNVLIRDIIEFAPKNNVPDDTDAGFVPLHLMGTRYLDVHGFEKKRWSEIKKGYTHFADGDVLLARITPSFENGKAGIAQRLPNGIGAGSTEYFVCRPIEELLHPKYLLAFFKTNRFLEDGERVMQGAAGQQRVPKYYVLEHDIPLAPYSEQKRITDKLDTLLARVDACHLHLERMPQIIKRFRQSVLTAATSGKLSALQHVDYKNIGWKRMTLEQVCHSVTDGNHQPPPKQKRGVPFITISDISDGRFDLSRATRFVSKQYYNQLQPERKAKLGDVLFSVTGSIAIPIFVSVNSPFVFQRHLGILKPNNSIVDGKYLAYALGTNDVKQQALSVATGIAQLTIPLRGLRKIEIPIPPLEEQNKIVHRVEILLNYAEHLETLYQNITEKVKWLIPSILAKAFQGELVEQDINAEHAEKLIQRVLEMRESKESKMKTKPSQTRKKKISTVKSRQSLYETLMASKGARLTPDQLFNASGYEATFRKENNNQEFFDVFYEELRLEIQNGRIREERPNKKNTYLRECFLSGRVRWENG